MSAAAQGKRRLSGHLRRPGARFSGSSPEEAPAALDTVGKSCVRSKILMLACPSFLDCRDYLYMNIVVAPYFPPSSSGNGGGHRRRRLTAWLPGAGETPVSQHGALGAASLGANLDVDLRYARRLLAKPRRGLPRLRQLLVEDSGIEPGNVQTEPELPELRVRPRGAPPAASRHHCAAALMD